MKKRIGFKTCCPNIFERIALFSIIISAYFIAPEISETIFGSQTGLYISLTTIIFYVFSIALVKGIKALISRFFAKKR